MGILATIKHLTPLPIYLLMFFCLLISFIGKGRWALVLLTLIIPLRNVIEKVQEYPGGNQVIDILVAGTLVSWFVSCTMTERRPFFEKSSMNFIAAMLIIYTTFSMLLGNYNLNGTFAIHLSEERIKDWKNFCLMPVLFFVTLNNITDRKWIIRILLAMVLSIVLMEYYTVDQIRMFSSLMSREKISGTFQFLGPNEVAAFFNLYTTIMIGVFFCLKPSRLAKWLLLVMIFINTFCIAFLYSRGAYLGFVVGLTFVFLFKAKKLLLPLVLIAVLWQTVLPEKVIERIKGTTNAYGQLDESTLRRLYIWEKGIDLYRKSPLVGMGYGVFRTLGLDLGDTHNIYIKHLVEQGLVGTFIFLMIILCLMRMGYVLYKKGKDDLSKGMGLGLMACQMVLIVNNLFGDRWSYFELNAYLWIFAGLVGRFIVISEHSPVPSPPQQKKLDSPKTPQIKEKKKIRYYDL
jgi:O-antigen ligase